ncbi:hypothetical protein ACWENQ_45585 [Nonomuraea sp. NPDC004354]
MPQIRITHQPQNGSWGPAAEPATVREAYDQVWAAEKDQREQAEARRSAR